MMLPRRRLPFLSFLSPLLSSLSPEGTCSRNVRLLVNLSGSDPSRLPFLLRLANVEQRGRPASLEPGRVIIIRVFVTVVHPEKNGYSRDELVVLRVPQPVSGGKSEATAQGRL